MKYTLTWTDANGKCWRLNKTHGLPLIYKRLRMIMPAIKRKKGTHATIITMTLENGS